MLEKRTYDQTTLNRRLRMSTREIVLAVALTLAALVAVVAARWGSGGEETALKVPAAEQPSPRGK
jgi:hypothetical protein